MKTVIAHKGVRVDGLGDRQGRERSYTQQNAKKGGYRPRTKPLYEYDTYDIHPDAIDARLLIVHRAQKIHGGRHEAEQDGEASGNNGDEEEEMTAV